MNDEEYMKLKKYEKPQLRVVELYVNQVVLGQTCKTTNVYPGQFNDPGSCINGNCQVVLGS